MQMKYDRHRKKTKRNLIILVLHIHFLVFSLIIVLRGMKKLKEKSTAQSFGWQVLERKARFFPALPEKDMKKPP